jgi:DMSO/TMAO reductase YedYZ molybdopterin-dependent catalytic subunit
VDHTATDVLAFSDGDHTTNLPLEDVVGSRARVAFAYAGQPLNEHGGPVRLLVPHLYFWKSGNGSAAFG